MRERGWEMGVGDQVPCGGGCWTLPAGFLAVISSLRTHRSWQRGVRPESWGTQLLWEAHGVAGGCWLAVGTKVPVWTLS